MVGVRKTWKAAMAVAHQAIRIEQLTWPLR
jgi:hypothetical protein